MRRAPWPVAIRKRGNRYPRPGERIAPATLRQVLMDRVPRDLGGDAVDGLRLADLDESAWSKFDRDQIDELAELVVSRVAANAARRSLDHRHFPCPPEGLRLRQLRLEHRTRLCLAREGFEDDPSLLGDCTIGEILAIRAFGPRCLVDLLSALESVAARNVALHRPLTEEAERLAELPEAALARSDDPRFAAMIHEVDATVLTAKELGDRLSTRSQDPARSPVRRAKGRPTAAAHPDHVGVDAGRGTQADFRLHAPPEEPRDRHRLLRLGRRPMPHPGGSRRPLWNDPRADPPNLRQACPTPGPSGHPGPGDGSRPGLRPGADTLSGGRVGTRHAPSPPDGRRIGLGKRRDRGQVARPADPASGGVGGRRAAGGSAGPGRRSGRRGRSGPQGHLLPRGGDRKSTRRTAPRTIRRLRRRPGRGRDAPTHRRVLLAGSPVGLVPAGARCKTRIAQGDRESASGGRPDSRPPTGRGGQSQSADVEDTPAGNRRSGILPTELGNDD